MQCINQLLVRTQFKKPIIMSFPGTFSEGSHTRTHNGGYVCDLGTLCSCDYYKYFSLRYYFPIVSDIKYSLPFLVLPSLVVFSRRFYTELKL